MNFQLCVVWLYVYGRAVSGNICPLRLWIICISNNCFIEYRFVSATPPPQIKKNNRSIFFFISFSIPIKSKKMFPIGTHNFEIELKSSKWNFSLLFSLFDRWLSFTSEADHWLCSIFWRNKAILFFCSFIRRCLTLFGAVYLKI